jgi:hypothetical protein
MKLVLTNVLDGYALQSSVLTPDDIVSAVNASMALAAEEAWTWRDVGALYGDHAVLADQGLIYPDPLSTGSQDNTVIDLPRMLHMAVVWMSASIIAEKFGQAPSGAKAPDWFLKRYSDSMARAKAFYAANKPTKPSRIRSATDPNMQDRIRL